MAAAVTGRKSAGERREEILAIAIEHFAAGGFRGASTAEIWHDVPGEGRLPGIDRERRSYLSRASFADPDGNTWQLQEVVERLPGRV